MILWTRIINNITVYLRCILEMELLGWFAIDVFLLSHSRTCSQRHLFPLSIGVLRWWINCNIFLRKFGRWVLSTWECLVMTSCFLNFIISQNGHMVLNLLVIVHKFINFRLSLMLDTVISSLIGCRIGRAHWAALLTRSHYSWLRATRSSGWSSNLFLALFEILRN